MNDLEAQIQRIIDELSPKERHVLLTKLGVDIPEGASWADVRKHLNVPEERIREVEAAAMKRLADRRGEDGDKQ